MKTIDGVLALLAGEMVGFLFADFLKSWGKDTNAYFALVFWVGLPILSIICLWIAELIGKKLPFIFQAAKFVLVGSSATVIDLKLFEFLAWTFGSSSVVLATIFKGISFLIATTLKYFGNKHWTFQKHEHKDIHKEVIKLLVMDAVSLAINVAAFDYFTKILGPQFNLPGALWIKLGVIFAALCSAVSNFLGYKFLVFKK